jgi:hypothetical protein
MKKLITLLSLIPLLSFGQGHFFGFEGGYTYSGANILSGTSGNVVAKHMYYGALNYQFHAEKWFFFNLGVRYDRKGFDLNNERVIHEFNDIEYPTDTIGNYSHDFHTVGVPFKLGFKLGGKVFALISAGIIPSYTIIGNTRSTLSYNGTELYSDSQNNWTNMKNFELPWIGEIGFGAYLGENVLLTITASYTQSLTKHLLPTQAYENNAQVTNYRTVRFKGIHAGIGLHFKLTKPKEKHSKYNPSN